MAYYELGAVQEVLQERLAVLREVIPKGSAVLDLGCNDGRIDRALLESGHASRVLGVDLEKAPDFQGQEFLARDLRSGDLDGLPNADIVLMLNVAHHLLLQGRDFVRNLLARLFERYPVVLLDMGSTSERDDWPWRGVMGRMWASDVEMWHELFASARWRRPLLDYPFQDGRRVLWKLVGPLEKPYEYIELQSWRRNATNDPDRKRLLSPDDPEAYDGVMFRKLRRRDSQELFWAKEALLWRAEESRQQMEDQIEEVVRRAPILASTSFERHPRWGRIYPYLHQMFEAPAIHYCTRQLYLDSDACQQAEVVAQLCAGEGPLANMPLSLITDFQTIVTSIGPVFLDWEPDPQQPPVKALLREGEAARREVQNRLYEPTERSGFLESSLGGAIHPATPRLAFRDRHRIAKDHVRRAQRLLRAGRVRPSMANYEAAVKLGPAAFWAWLTMLRWHLINVARLLLGRTRWAPWATRPQSHREPPLRL